MELDVWLERTEPRIIVRDVDSRRVLLHWDSTTLRREFAHGCLEDLCNTRLGIAERLGLVAQALTGRPRHLHIEPISKLQIARLGKARTLQGAEIKPNK